MTHGQPMPDDDEGHFGFDLVSSLVSFLFVGTVGLTFYNSFQDDNERQRAVEQTAAALQTAECQLLERNLRGNGLWDCHGVKVRYDREFLRAWQEASGDRTP